MLTYPFDQIQTFLNFRTYWWWNTPPDWHIERVIWKRVKLIVFNFFFEGVRVTYNSDIFEKLRPPTWGFKCPNLNPPIRDIVLKFSRFLIMKPPLTSTDYHNAARAKLLHFAPHSSKWIQTLKDLLALCASFQKFIWKNPEQLNFSTVRNEIFKSRRTIDFIKMNILWAPKLDLLDRNCGQFTLDILNWDPWIRNTGNIATFATLGFILDSQLIWESCKMEPQRGIILMRPPTHPPTPCSPSFSDSSKDYWKPVLRWGVPPLLDTCSENMCGVPYSRYTLFCAVPPPLQFSFVPWTLWLRLGFWAKLRIWQVPACKMLNLYPRVWHS